MKISRFTKKLLVLIAGVGLSFITAVSTFALYTRVNTVGANVSMENQTIGQDYFSGGTGTSGDPFKIATATDLKELQKLQSIGTFDSTTYYFEMTKSIAWSGDPLLPIGNEYHPFIGNFNGNGHGISNLKILGYETNDVGMFGYVGTGGTVRNIILDCPSIETGESDLEYGETERIALMHESHAGSTRNVVSAWDNYSGWSYHTRHTPTNTVLGEELDFFRFSNHGGYLQSPNGLFSTEADKNLHIKAHVLCSYSSATGNGSSGASQVDTPDESLSTTYAAYKDTVYLTLTAYNSSNQSIGTKTLTVQEFYDQTNNGEPVHTTTIANWALYDAYFSMDVITTQNVDHWRLDKTNELAWTPLYGTLAGNAYAVDIGIDVVTSFCGARYYHDDTYSGFVVGHNAGTVNHCGVYGGDESHDGNRATIYHARPKQEMISYGPIGHNDGTSTNVTMLSSIDGMTYNKAGNSWTGWPANTNAKPRINDSFVSDSGSNYSELNTRQNPSKSSMGLYNFHRTHDSTHRDASNNLVNDDVMSIDFTTASLSSFNISASTVKQFGWYGGKAHAFPGETRPEYGTTPFMGTTVTTTNTLGCGGFQFHAGDGIIKCGDTLGSTTVYIKSITLYLHTYYSYWTLKTSTSSSGSLTTRTEVPTEVYDDTSSDLFSGYKYSFAESDHIRYFTLENGSGTGVCKKIHVELYPSVPYTVEATGLTITEKNDDHTINVGETLQLYATVTPKGSTQTDVTWSIWSNADCTSSTSAASITPGGLVSGLLEGTVYVKAHVTAKSHIQDVYRIVVYAVPTAIIAYKATMSGETPTAYTQLTNNEEINVSYVPSTPQYLYFGAKVNFDGKNHIVSDALIDGGATVASTLMDDITISNSNTYVTNAEVDTTHNYVKILIKAVGQSTISFKYVEAGVSKTTSFIIKVASNNPNVTSATITTENFTISQGQTLSVSASIGPATCHSKAYRWEQSSTDGGLIRIATRSGTSSSTPNTAITTNVTGNSVGTVKLKIVVGNASPDEEGAVESTEITITVVENTGEGYILSTAIGELTGYDFIIASGYSGNPSVVTDGSGHSKSTSVYTITSDRKKIFTDNDFRVFSVTSDASGYYMSSGAYYYGITSTGALTTSPIKNADVTLSITAQTGGSFKISSSSSMTYYLAFNNDELVSSTTSSNYPYLFRHVNSSNAAVLSSTTIQSVALSETGTIQMNVSSTHVIYALVDPVINTTNVTWNLTGTTYFSYSASGQCNRVCTISSKASGGTGTIRASVSGTNSGTTNLKSSASVVTQTSDTATSGTITGWTNSGTGSAYSDGSMKLDSSGDYSYNYTFFDSALSNVSKIEFTIKLKQNGGTSQTTANVVTVYFTTSTGTTLTSKVLTGGTTTDDGSNRVFSTTATEYTFTMTGLSLNNLRGIKVEYTTKNTGNIGFYFISATVTTA